MMKAQTHDPVPMVVTTITLAVVLMLGVACNRNHGSATDTCPHDKGFRTYEQWRRGVTFPYVAPEEKLRRVKQNYGRVVVGSQNTEVVEAFGPPDFEEELYTKEPDRPCNGYQFRYYFEKPEELANEFNDKAISVFFTPDGKAKWIVGNVGLAEKGSPAHEQ